MTREWRAGMLLLACASLAILPQTIALSMPLPWSNQESSRGKQARQLGNWLGISSGIRGLWGKRKSLEAKEKFCRRSTVPPPPPPAPAPSPGGGGSGGSEGGERAAAVAKSDRQWWEDLPGGFLNPVYTYNFFKRGGQCVSFSVEVGYVFGPSCF